MASRPRVVRRTPRRVRRALVLRAGKQLGDEHGQHDLTRELGLRPVPALDTQGPGKERAKVAPHLRQMLSHAGSRWGAVYGH
jgi:hypothetical protein